MDSDNKSLKKYFKELEQEKIILFELEKELTQKVKTLEETKQNLENIILKNSTSAEELRLEKELASKINQVLTTHVNELEKVKAYHENEIHENHRTIKELKQEKIIFAQMNNSLEETIRKLEETNLEMKSRLHQVSNHNRLSFQAKSIMAKTFDEEHSKSERITRKYYLTITISAIVFTAIIIPYSLYAMTLVGQEHQVEDLGNMKSSYIVQNLKGDTIDTWLSWRLSDGAALYVNILNAKQYPEKANLIKDAILSTEFYEIDDNILGKAPKGTISQYYLGWAGALDAASKNGPTEFYIPTSLKVTDSGNGAGDITITLSNVQNGDGYTGWTKSIADESQNQILKSDITIYDVENLSDNQLIAIMRHELGHALGLAHSSAEEDLMFPTLETSYPYISDCDIDAIVNLYDGGKKSEVVCEK